MSRSSKVLRRVDDLIAQGFVPAASREKLEKVAAQYAVALTSQVASLIARGDPTDPMARQYVPDVRELDVRPIERADPIGDHAHSPVEGIVHRYPDRLLLKLVSVCAVYCRFCFRREMVGPGKANTLSPEAYADALHYIRSHHGIWEVILTGGDPLMLSPRRLRDVMADLAAIPHVKVVRLHTRIPVADPQRITAETLDALRMKGVATWIAIHANHPREFDPRACEAIAAMADAGLALVSQSVLLRGVNDDIATMTALMRCFVENRIKPYYLHHGDLAPGTAHLRVTLEEGQALMGALRGRVSGLCQPDYVLDIPGGHGKSPVGPSYLSGGGPDYRIMDYCGEVHIYPPDSGVGA